MFYDGDRLLGMGTLSSGKAMLVSAELSSELLPLVCIRVIGRLALLWVVEDA